MANYLRITVYHPGKDVSAIIDCNGKFEQPWELSVFMIQKGFNVLEIGNENKFLEGNISRIPEETNKLMLRACMQGKPAYNGKNVEVNGKSYNPNKNN